MRGGNRISIYFIWNSRSTIFKVEEDGAVCNGIETKILKFKNTGIKF